MLRDDGCLSERDGSWELTDPVASVPYRRRSRRCSPPASRRYPPGERAVAQRAR